jgi:hypothetical protein
VKLYSQHGHADGQKTLEGITNSYIDGVIFSPKDIALDKLTETIARIRSARRNAEIWFDPETYACFAAVDPTSRLGRLDEHYGQYFQARRRVQLQSEKQLVSDIEATVEFQEALDLTGVIAPNILIPRSFDSTEAAISTDFIRNARAVGDRVGITRPLYVTLAIGRDALLDREELMRFLNDLTFLDQRPDGFYLLIGVNNSEARAEAYHADVIGAWMLMNYALSVNGYKIINGYSDILTPFLGAARATAGAFGWWSNLRSFSLDRFAPPMGGGKPPIERYLSTRLLNRITYYELDAWKRFEPSILNGLPTDALYPDADGSQPARNQEVFQSWEAVKDLNSKLVTTTVTESLRRCKRAVAGGRDTYDKLSAHFAMTTKSNDAHIEALEGGLTLFERLAELSPS